MEAEGKEDSKKIELHLDGSDFQGFGLRMLSLVVVSLLIICQTEIDGLLVFFMTTICWLTFFAYKIARFKEKAYRQIIDDLEAKNTKLEKGNKLLQNVVQDSFGIRVTTEEKTKN